MSKCGIKKYDELPSRVGFKDVDAMRAALSKSIAVVEQLKRKLDEAIKINKINKQKKKGGKDGIS
jgi:hypothetical protein